ncbi:MAG: hypothetical protein FJ241_11100 [Nitrospira sp.]|nr:hypothetical protein [Nitrospira sp.]
MKGPKAIFERDAQINSAIKEIRGIVKKKRVETDRRGQWFANSQLDNSMIGKPLVLPVRL